jgi:opacity protein-like surface antigen
MKLGAWMMLVVLGTTAAAFAQTPNAARGFIVVNGGYQLTANDFTDGAIKRENAEDGRLDTTYTVRSGPAFDIAGGGIIWGRLGVGVGVSRFSVSTPSTLKATIPHPFFFDRSRSVSGDVAGLQREELAVHVQLRGIFPAGERFQVMVFGGPSFFQVKQGVITDYSYNESYPYDKASFRSATTTTASASKIGFNAGGDVAFFFTRQIGVGATVQFAGTKVQVPAALGATREVKVGGGQAGAGLRLRF